MRLDFFLIFSAFFLFSTTTTDFQIQEYDSHQDLSFNCGIWKFHHQTVVDAVAEALRVKNSRKRGDKKYPVYYDGSLFEGNLGYMMWPLRVDGLIHKLKMPISFVYVIFDPNLNDLTTVKGVIARLSNRTFIKCTRLNQPLLESISGVQNVENLGIGYNCGETFIDNDIIPKWMSWIKSNFNKGWIYPTAFQGFLYSQNLGYYISPISNNKNPGASRWLMGTYFIVVDSEYRLIDIIAKMKIGDYIKCPKEFKLKAKENIESSQGRLIPSPRPSVTFEEDGFLCGQDFFPNSYLRASLKLAKTSSQRKTVQKIPIKNNLPQIDSSSLLWSIFPGGQLFEIGTAEKYFMVMDQSFNMINVIVKSSDKVGVCNHATRTSNEIFPETDSFKCERVSFESSWLEITAKTACENFDDSESVYPAPYKGPGFNVPGPYFTYPLFEDVFYKKRIGLHRIVINPNCIIAGVLELKSSKGSLGHRLHKCKRKSDRSIPGVKKGFIHEFV